MKILLKRGKVINVFTGEIEESDVLIENNVIIGVGEYNEDDADIIKDVSHKYICPGLIDGHIHIESTMLTPVELAKVVLAHGTTSIVADPHEIANVCGIEGIEYILGKSEDIPLHVYVMLPSCVPATQFDESATELMATDLEPYYDVERVLGLAEMMNYPGVLSGDLKVKEKIHDAVARNLVVDGHAPLVTGRDLDRYIAAGIQSDHECSNEEEAKERVRKGQWVMIRQGTAARNLEGLLPMFNDRYKHRCILVTDDRHPSDLLEDGHIDNIIRLAVKNGKSVITAIQMATIQAAQCFNLRLVGAIAPGYRADILVLDDLEQFKVRDVYSEGEQVVDNGKVVQIEEPWIDDDLYERICTSFHMNEVSEKDFVIKPEGVADIDGMSEEEAQRKVRVIKIIEEQLLTQEWQTQVNLKKDNGIDIERDILKLAVIERHNYTGHIGLGYISGIGLKEGAIAASVSHDSHNLIVIGTNEKDMALAANHIKKLEGGSVVVKDGQILADMQLKIGGLMAVEPASYVAEKNLKVREMVYELGVPKEIEPFMTMAFVSLPVIPDIKMSTKGLIDVNKQERVSLFVDE